MTDRCDERMRAFRIAYDGRPFCGFQRQPDVPTVEDALFRGLRSLSVLAADDETPVGYAAAGRTDAGVSALAQTVAFECPAWLTPAALDSELPRSVRAWAMVDAPTGFHATHDATARTYTYYLRAPETGTEPETGVDVGSTTAAERARAVLDALASTHDVHNLTPDDRGTERTLETGLERDGPFLALTFRSDGFPRQFVRRAVTLVREVAAGVLPFSRVDRVLSGATLSGPEGIGPAPAHPLVLAAVAYPDLAFDVDERAAADAREDFTRRRAEHATRARVAGRIADGIDR